MGTGAMLFVSNQTNESFSITYPTQEGMATMPPSGPLPAFSTSIGGNVGPYYMEADFGGATAFTMSLSGSAGDSFNLNFEEDDYLFSINSGRANYTWSNTANTIFGSVTITANGYSTSPGTLQDLITVWIFNYNPSNPLSK